MKFTCLYIIGFTVFISSFVESTSDDLVLVVDIVDGDEGAVHSAPFKTFDFTRIPLDMIGFPYSVTFDPVDNKLYWSDLYLDHIARASVDGSNFGVVIDDVNSDVIAVDSVSRVIFWADRDNSNIWRALLSGTERKIILDKIDGTAGIVIDELASHIYWTSDGKAPKIERANADGSGRFILVDENLISPQGLAIDFTDKRMYWCDVDRNSIEVANLLGDNRQTLLQEDPLMTSLFPVAIAVRGDYVYWTSWQIRSLVRIDKYGKQPPEIIGSVNLEQAGGIYISRVVNETTCEINCQNGGACRQLSEGYECICPSMFLGDLCETASDTSCALQVQPCLNGGRCVQESNGYSCVCRGGYYGEHCDIGNDNSCSSNPCGNRGRCVHLALQGYQCICPDMYTGPNCDVIEVGSCVSNPCMNGICQPLSEGYRCECQHGFSGQLCETDDIMFVADQLGAVIYKASISNVAQTFKALPLDSPNQPSDLEVDRQEKWLYWTDISTGTISRSRFDGSGEELFINGLQKPDGLAISTITRTVFWINNDAEIQGSGLDEVNRRTILSNLDLVQDIAVHSVERRLYWTSVGSQPKIERANENGMQKETLIDTNVVFPTGLTLEQKESRLYWTDAGRNIIETAKLDGSNRKVLSDLSLLSVLDTFNVAIHENFLYWTAGNLNTLGVVHRYLGIANTAGPTIFQKATGLVIYSSVMLDTDSDPCNPNPCQNEGQCYAGKCSCISEFTGDRCEIPFCLQVNELELSWPAAPANVLVGVDSIQRCPIATARGGQGLAYRSCFLDDNGGAKWGSITERDCGQEEELDLEILSGKPISEGNVEEVAAILTALTQTLVENGVTPQNISDVADIILTVVGASSGTIEVTTGVIGVCSNIVTAVEGIADGVLYGDQFSAILRALDDQINRSTTMGYVLDPVVLQNIAVTTMNVDIQQASNLGLNVAVRQNPTADEFRQYDIIIDGVEVTELRTAISLPPSIFNTFTGETVGVGFTVHNSATLFPGSGTVASDVIAANIAGNPNLNNLQENITIEFKVPPGDIPTCMFWDFDIENWSNEGCWLLGQSRDGRVICSCNHLTNFAVIAILDTKNPVISVISDIMANTDPGQPSATVRWSRPTATDDSGYVTLTSDYQSGESFSIGKTEVTYIAIDLSGNFATSTLTITVKDNESPQSDSCLLFKEKYTDQLSLNVTLPDIVFYDNSQMQVDFNSTHESPVLFSLGTHEVVINAWDPYGNTATCFITINIIAACMETSAILDSQSFSWPLTVAEQQGVYSNERCDVRTANRGKGIALRDCEFSEDNGGSKWREATFEGCGENEEYALPDLVSTPVVEDNVVNIADALNNVTQELDDPTTDNIKDIAQTLMNIVDVESDTPEVTTTVVGILDNIVTVTEDSSTHLESDDTPNESNALYFLDMLMAFEEQVTRTTGIGQNLSRVVKPNIVLQTFSVQTHGQSTIEGLSFAVRQNNGDEDNFREEDISTKDNIPETETRTSIALPTSIFNTATGNENVGVTFFVQRSDILFASNSTNDNNIVGSDVISAIVVGIPNTSNLPEPVVLEYTTPTDVGNHSCVSWDFNISDWSDEGCRLVNDTKKGVTSKRIVCHCDHLTNFAVLVDVSYRDTHVILDVISKIGCGVSIAALLFTLILFLAYRRLRTGVQATPRKILIQLCIALLLLYLVFLAGIDQISNSNECIAVAALLHFLTLASIMWMGVEAHNLYLNVAKVFDAQAEHFVLKASIVAWGVPLVATAISLGVGFQYYSHQEYCFVATGPSLNYGLVLPVGVVLLHNLITFSIVMFHLCKLQLGGNVTKQSQSKKIMQRLQNAFAISILMGLTWVFGFFAIGDAKVFVSTIFCVCNSFQGMVVFILFCLRQEDVRKVLRPFCRLMGCSCDAFQQRSNQPSTVTSHSQSKSTYKDSDFQLTAMPSQAMISGENRDDPGYEPAPRKETREKPYYASADDSPKYESRISTHPTRVFEGVISPGRTKTANEAIEHSASVSCYSTWIGKSTDSAVYDTPVVALNSQATLPSADVVITKTGDIKYPLIEDDRSDKNTDTSAVNYALI